MNGKLTTPSLATASVSKVEIVKTVIKLLMVAAPFMLIPVARWVEVKCLAVHSVLLSKLFPSPQQARRGWVSRSRPRKARRKLVGGFIRKVVSGEPKYIGGNYDG